MKSGVYLRTSGRETMPSMIVEQARIAEAAGIDDLWVTDHIAIPPDDAEGSGGLYYDPLAILAHLAAVTERVGLGTAVLVLPYRPALPTAKWVATIQALSGGRLLLGVGVGWMEAEFRAVGVPRNRRGAVADATLEFLHRCFAADEVEANGQPFFFLPRPDRPPIIVGGAPPHAFRRAVQFGDGWMPMANDPATLAAPIKELRAQAVAAGRPVPEVVVLTSLPFDDVDAAAARVQAFADVGATRLVQAGRYPDTATFARAMEALAGSVARSSASSGGA